jgi:hypothetical protein
MAPDQRALYLSLGRLPPRTSRNSLLPLGAVVCWWVNQPINFLSCHLLCFCGPLGSHASPANARCMQRGDDRLAFAAVRRVVLVLIVRFHPSKIIGRVLLRWGTIHGGSVPSGHEQRGVAWHMGPLGGERPPDGCCVTAPDCRRHSTHAASAGHAAACGMRSQ